MSLTRRTALGLLLAWALLSSAPAALALCNQTTCSAAAILADPSCCGATSCALDTIVLSPLSGQVCDLDFEGRNVVLNGTLRVGSNTVSIEAGTLRIVGLIDASASPPSPGGIVRITTTGANSSSALGLVGGSGSGIILRGSGGGVLTVHADGPVALTGGTIDASAAATDPNADGGTIEIDSSAGDLVIGAPVLADSGAGGFGGSITINFPSPAGNVAVTDSGRLRARGGIGDGGSIDVTAGGAVSISGLALLQVSGIGGSAGSGGSIDITANAMTVNGVLEASGAGDSTGDAGGDGGSIALEATEGALTLLRGTQSLSVDGAAGGGDGELCLTSDSPAAGDLMIAAPVSAQGNGGSRGRPGGGGTVEASSARGLTITRTISVAGTGGASGEVDLSAARDVVLNASIVGNDPAGGGSLSVESGHDTVFNAVGGNNVKMNAVDSGPGGTVSISAGNDVRIVGFTLDATGAGTGVGGRIEATAGHDLTVDRNSLLKTNSSAMSGAVGGSIALAAGFVAPPPPSLVGSLVIDGDVTAIGHSRTPTGRPGAVELSACQIVISDTGLVDTSNGDPGSFNRVVTRTNTGHCRNDLTKSCTSLTDCSGNPCDLPLAIIGNGKLLTTTSNIATYRSDGPPPSGGTVKPAFSAGKHCSNDASRACMNDGDCVAPGTCVPNLMPEPACTGAASDPADCLMPCPQCGNGGRPEFPEDCDPPSCPTCDIHCRAFHPPSCDDRNPCTMNDCDPVYGCVNTPLADGSDCDDGDACSTGDGSMGDGDVCAAGVCIGPTPLDCDDGDVCTDDTCDPAHGCVHTPVVCADDGNRCNGAETCSNPIGCHHGTLVTCPPGKVCDPPTGNCVPKPCTGAADCDDGNPCTLDTCSAGPCEGGFCCSSTPQSGTVCSDGDPCNDPDTCQGGVCTPGTGSCDDHNACTTDSCDPTRGCQHAAILGCTPCPPDCANPCAQCIDGRCENIPGCCTTDADCDDGNPCTANTCDTNQRQCVHPSLDGSEPGCEAPCASCVSGACHATDCPDPNPNDCNVAFCDPSPSGGCTLQPAAECCLTSAAECDDGDPCTLDTCDTDVKHCVHAPLKPECIACRTDTDCDVDGGCSGVVCGGDGTCTPARAPNCDDRRPSGFSGICRLDAALRPYCEYHCLTDQACGDGNACNGTERCSAGSCLPGTPLACDDGDTCTDDSCDPAHGCVNAPKTGYASVACRLDTIEAALAVASPTDVAASVRTKLGTLIGKARAKLAAAESTGTGKRALRSLAAAGRPMKAIGKAAGAALKKRKIDGGLAKRIIDAASSGGDALGQLKKSIAP